MKFEFKVKARVVKIQIYESEEVRWAIQLSNGAYIGQKHLSDGRTFKCWDTEEEAQLEFDKLGLGK